MLLLNPDQILHFLGLSDRSGFVTAVGVILIIKIWLLIFLIAYVVFRRLQRLITRWRNQERSMAYLRQIFVCAYSPRDEEVEIGWMDRFFFRRLLLSQMTVMEDAEQRRLIFLYKKLGYWNDDIEALQSRLWWVRLAAMIRFEICRSAELEGLFLRMIDDPNDLVAIVAMRAISTIEYSGMIDPILDSLSRRAPARRDIFVEILSNFGASRSEEILSYLDKTYDPYLASLCIEVLGNLESSEALPKILSFLQSSDDQVVIASVIALRKIPDVDQYDQLRPLLDHESENVRAETMRTLHSLSDPQLSWAHQKLKQDSSLSVRRALFDLRLAS